MTIKETDWAEETEGEEEEEEPSVSSLTDVPLTFSSCCPGAGTGTRRHTESSPRRLELRKRWHQHTHMTVTLHMCLQAVRYLDAGRAQHAGTRLTFQNKTLICCWIHDKQSNLPGKLGCLLKPDETMTALLNLQPELPALSVEGRGFRRVGLRSVLLLLLLCFLENAEPATKTQEGRAAVPHKAARRPPRPWGRHYQCAAGGWSPALQHPPHTQHGLGLFKYTQIQLKGKQKYCGLCRQRRDTAILSDWLSDWFRHGRLSRHLWQACVCSVWKLHTRSLQVEPRETTNHFSFFRTRRNDVIN